MPSVTVTITVHPTAHDDKGHIQVVVAEPYLASATDGIAKAAARAVAQATAAAETAAPPNARDIPGR